MHSCYTSLIAVGQCGNQVYVYTCVYVSLCYTARVHGNSRRKFKENTFVQHRLDAGSGTLHCGSMHSTTRSCYMPYCMYNIHVCAMHPMVNSMHDDFYRVEFTMNLLAASSETQILGIFIPQAYHPTISYLCVCVCVCTFCWELSLPYAEMVCQGTCHLVKARGRYAC